MRRARNISIQQALDSIGANLDSARRRIAEVTEAQGWAERAGAKPVVHDALDQYARTVERWTINSITREARDAMFGDR